MICPATTQTSIEEDWMDPDLEDPDVCSHGKSFSEKCVECCPEDDDGSWTGDEWSEG